MDDIEGFDLSQGLNLQEVKSETLHEKGNPHPLHRRPRARIP